MTRTTRALMVGAAAGGLAATVVARGGRGHGARSRSRTSTGAVTVSGPAAAVTRVWRDLGGTATIEVVDAPGDFGTEVRVPAPAGGDGAGDGGDHQERLRRVKAVVEAGEVVTVEGQPSGRGPVAEGLTRAVTRRLRAGGVA